MTNLKKTLRSAGYDLIDSPVRNHKPLQLWLKKPGNSVQLYYDHIEHALHSEVELKIVEDPALSIDYNQKNEYKFNVGITVLKNLLTSLGFSNLGLSLDLSGGKKLTIAFDKSKSHIVTLGPLESFLSSADFKHPNPSLLENANRDNILIITGVLMAQNILVDMEFESNLKAGLEAELNDIAEGSATFEKTSNKTLKMLSEGNVSFPVAVKANRIDWDKGEFDKTVLVTDNRNFF